MVHALSQVHRSLRSDGSVLDVHPDPENSQLEIWQDLDIHVLGEIDQAQDIVDIEQARDRLALMKRRGLFATIDQRHFDMLDHYPSVEDWLHRWEEEGWVFSVEQEQLDRARELLATGEAELVIRESVQATALKRLPGDNV